MNTRSEEPGAFDIEWIHAETVAGPTYGRYHLTESSYTTTCCCQCGQGWTVQTTGVGRVTSRSADGGEVHYRETARGDGAAGPAHREQPHRALRRDLFGFGIDAVTMPEAVRQCTDAVRHGNYLSVGMVNAAKVVGTRRDEPLREAVASSALVLADGQAVVWASRLLGQPLPERVAGIDLFLELLGEADRRAYRVYFLGAKQEVLDQMLAEVSRRYPGLTVAGSRDGYFRPEEEPDVAAEIRKSRADLLFVGMSSPKKEFFLSQWGERTQAGVVHGVGGSFDVLAGITKRAPRWCQGLGLEWLYRAWQEPVRLGRRYLTTNLAFMTLVARERMRRDRLHEVPPGEPGPLPAVRPADDTQPWSSSPVLPAEARGERR
jgi:N-acetylglucosaminyldiphosphoundecaprenol N-acetyl-beta-D-mannosaminyltransferase